MSERKTGGKNLNEFVYKGAIVRPYEPFTWHESEKRFRGSIRGGISRTLFANEPPPAIIIEINEEADIIKPS